MTLSVTEITERLAKRLDHLAEAVREHGELQELLTHLSGKAAPALPGSDSDPARSAPATPRKPRRRTRARGKRMPEPQRKEQIVSLVAERPMIDAAGIAAATQLSKPRVSQLTGALINEGLLQRSDGGYITTPKDS